MSYTIGFNFDPTAEQSFDDQFDDQFSAAIQENTDLDSGKEFDDQIAVIREVLPQMIAQVGTADTSVVVSISGIATKKHKGAETLNISVRTA